MGIAIGEEETFWSEQRKDGSLNKQGPELAARYARLLRWNRSMSAYARHVVSRLWCLSGLVGGGNISMHRRG
jgi:hypothetical protein